MHKKLIASMTQITDADKKIPDTSGIVKKNRLQC